MPDYERSTTRRRPGTRTRPCAGCGQPFPHVSRTGNGSVPIVVETTEVSIMRGEDKVRFFHPECSPEGK